MRASSVPTLYAGCLKKAVVFFCLLHGSAFAVDFAIFVVSFLVPPDDPKNGTVKVLSFVLLLCCACSPKNGTARRPFLGPCLGSCF